jgi:hypothetical protein
MNITNEQFTEEVDREIATNKHKYLYRARDEVAKRLGINQTTAEHIYYQTKKKKLFRVWIQQVNASMFDVKAEDIESARATAIRMWRGENHYPVVEAAQELNTESEDKTK